MPARIDLRGINGKPVRDANRPLVLHITAKDVAQADVQKPETCAAARAITRECHAEEVRVHLGRVYVRKAKTHWVRYMTPAALRNEIIAFDRGGRFEPGEYVLLPTTPSQRATGKRQGSKPKKTKGRKVGRPSVMVKNVRMGPTP